MARYPIELGVVRRSVRRNIRYLIELRAVKEFVRRNARYSIELVVVKRMLVEMQVSDLVESCKKFVRGIPRY